MTKSLTLSRKIGAVAAIVGALVPIALAMRRRFKRLGGGTRTAVASAREAARKLPHHGKPRKARRLARHLAKTVGQTG